MLLDIGQARVAKARGVERCPGRVIPQRVVHDEVK